jgi:hypothetical protein
MTMRGQLIRIVLLVSFLYGNGLAYATNRPTYRHDSRNSGRSPGKIIGPPLTKVWEYETDYYVESSPAVEELSKTVSHTLN